MTEAEKRQIQIAAQHGAWPWNHYILKLSYYSLAFYAQEAKVLDAEETTKKRTLDVHTHTHTHTHAMQRTSLCDHLFAFLRAHLRGSALSRDGQSVAFHAEFQTLIVVCTCVFDRRRRRKDGAGEKGQLG